MTGLDSPTEGEVFLNHENIAKYTEREWDSYRNTKVGIVFQNFNLVEDMTVEENIGIALKIQKNYVKDYKTEIKKVLKYVGLEGYEKRKKYELSAGQMQRVAIARAIIKKPQIVIADEATGNLDPVNTEIILKLFNDISKKCLVLLISHDRIAAEKYGDRIISLDNGKIIKDINNIKVKNLYLQPYLISLKKDNMEVTKSLETFNLKEEIASNGEWDNNICKNISFELTVRSERVEVIKPANEKWSDNICEPKNMPFRDLTKNSFTNIKKQKIRMLITTFLITFICLFFLIINICANNDYILSLKQYVMNSNKECIWVTKEVSIEKDNEVIKRNIIRGIEFFNVLEKDIGAENLIKSYNSVDMKYSSDKTTNINVCIYNKCSIFEKINIEGALPSEDNQITLNYSNANDIKIGDKVLINGIECDVVGFSDFVLTENDIEYAVISANVINESIRINKKINLQGFDISCSTNKSEFPYVPATISSVNSLVEYNNELVYGRYPQNNNEIIVSSEFAMEIGDYSEDKMIEKYHIPDIHDEKYNGFYDEMLNMYDYTGRNVNIVGIYDSAKTDNKIGDIVFNDEVYNCIIEDYIKMLNYDECWIYIKNANYNVLKNITEHGYIIEDDVCKEIYSFIELTEDLKDVLKITIAISCGMISIVLVLFFTYNVKDHSKKIGILRALGVKISDICKMFIIESATICFIAMVLTILCAKIIVNIVNSKINSIIGVYDFDLYHMNIGASLFICFAIFIFGMLVTVTPIIKMAKSKSINLINIE